jgi:hypothetical protein
VFGVRRTPSHLVVLARRSIGESLEPAADLAKRTKVSVVHGR